jgi:hypothetical protein
MNAFFAIITGLIVTVGSGITALAPISKRRERFLRVLGVCFTLAGGLLGVTLGLRSAAKTNSLLSNTAEILQNSSKTLRGIDETLTTSKGVLKETQENLEKTNATLRIASDASAIVNEASSFSSGGDAFPEVFAYAVTREDGKSYIGFSLHKVSKYPLYGLDLHVGRPYRTALKDSTVQTLGISKEFREFNTNASVPIWFYPMPDSESVFFTAYMTARNGVWEEVIQVRKVGERVATRWVIYGTKDASRAPYKKVLDLADADFPSEERNHLIYPISELSLPLAPR